MKITKCLRCWWILLLAIPLAAQSSRIYVLNNKGQNPSVDVIDPATNKVVQKIDGIPGAHGAIFSPDARRAYITSETKDTLYDVDTATGKILKELALSRGSANIPALADGGRRLFVCINGLRNKAGHVMSQLPSSIDVVDTRSFKVVKVLPTRGGMHDCYSTPDEKYILAGSFGAKFLDVWDARTEKLLWSIDFGKGVTTIAQELGPDGSTRRLFIPLAHYRGFADVDFATHQYRLVPLPAEPSGVLLGKPLERRNNTPTHGDAISPDGKTLWVCSRGSGGVFVYSLPDLKVVKFIATPTVKGVPPPANGGDPGWITFTPDGKTVYIANAAADSVSVIDAKTMKEVAVIPVGRQPDHIFTMVLPSHRSAKRHRAAKK